MSRINGDLFVAGGISSVSMTLPAASVGNSQVAAGANIDATKLVHQHALHYGQDAGADVVSKTHELHIVYGTAASVASIEVVASTAPTGGDKAFTVDLQKSTAGGAFATILSSVITFNSSSVSRVKQSGTIASASLVAGDILRVIITASGSTGSQGQGLCVTVNVRENPQ